GVCLPKAHPHESCDFPQPCRKAQCAWSVPHGQALFFSPALALLPAGGRQRCRIFTRSTESRARIWSTAFASNSTNRSSGLGRPSSAIGGKARRTSAVRAQRPHRRGVAVNRHHVSAVHAESVAEPVPDSGADSPWKDSG